MRTDVPRSAPPAARARRAVRRRLLLPAAFAALLLLAACDLLTDGAALAELYQYERLDGSGPLYDPSQGNCLVHEFGTPSQGFHVAGSGFHVAGSGFHVAGSAGGLTARPPSTPIVPSDLPTALAATDAVHDAAVLVVDDFAGAGFVLDAELFELESADSAALEQLIARGTFSHGAMVMHHVNATIAASGLYDLGDVDLEQVSWTRRGSGARLVVREADAQGFNADVVPAAIDGGLRALAGQGITRVAVNMSFALVPCSIVDDFIANLAAFPVFEDYLNAVTGYAGGAAVGRLIDGIRAATAGDPLQRYLRDQDFLAGGERVLVAAAGNFSRDYAMYPAAWPEVLSVSASDAQATGQPAFFSNAGEVLDAGAWYQLEGVGLWVEAGRRSRLSYAGSSFAAPAVAAMSAIDLASEAPRCALPADDATLLAHGAETDVVLATAIRRFCR